MKKRGVQMSRRRKKAGEKARTMAGSAEAEKTAAGSTPAEQEAGSTSAKETLSASIEPAERSENEAEVWQTGARVRIADMEPDYSDITVKNPRIGKVMRLEEEVQRQSEIEKLRSRRIRQEQEYIDRMSLSVENHLRNTKEEQRYNEQFEERIRTEVYRMHGISEDKLQGMTEYRNAWYQGTAFAMFFLSLVLIAICGILHGFGSEICIFMAFYTAIEGVLLSNGRKQSLFFTVLTKGVYLLLFPVMLVTFTCYELGFEEYALLVPVFAVAGVVVLMIGALSYFLYDPYRMDRRNRKKANRYIVEIEKAALKEVRLKERAFAKQEKKQAKFTRKEEARAQKKAERDERRRQRKEARAERHARWRAWWSEKLARLKFVKKESADETHKSPANADTTEEHSAEGDSVERESAERDSAEAESAERESAEEHSTEGEVAKRD
ncbi:MAG: hypothetical protein ACLR0V_15240 [Roseburia hominis]|jgi:hypothetical protein|uniref:hypothetical protein n=1 Tax=Roseburia hominis TaxID=301301 RepID=UPI0026727657|nr:hypothetical protein [Roseburia hominis]